MSERPILFSGPLVRALLAGTKTQTRRLVTPQPGPPGPSHAYYNEEEGWWTFGDNTGRGWRCPFGAAGDRLWVKETIRADVPGDPNSRSHFVADGAPTKADCWPWQRPVLTAVHTPRGLSRITLEVTAVRAERLQAITTAAIEAEGLTIPPCDCSVNDTPDRLDGERDAYAREKFRELWDAINGKRATWAANPWVWVVSFRRLLTPPEPRGKRREPDQR